MWSRIINEHLLWQLSLLLEKANPTAFKGADEFINALLAIFENITGNNKVLLNQSVSIIKYLMPILLKKFWSESNDEKFMSVKIFTDIITHYLSDETIFDLSSLK